MYEPSLHLCPTTLKSGITQSRYKFWSFFFFFAFSSSVQFLLIYLRPLKNVSYLLGICLFCQNFLNGLNELRTELFIRVRVCVCMCIFNKNKIGLGYSVPEHAYAFLASSELLIRNYDCCPTWTSSACSCANHAVLMSS